MRLIFTLSTSTVTNRLSFIADLNDKEAVDTNVESEITEQGGLAADEICWLKTEE